MPKNSPVSPSLESVKHLSARLQRKLVKRASGQRKRFRSSGKSYPLVMDMPGTQETRSGPVSTSFFTPGQRVVFAIASLVMLLMFALLGIAAVMHANRIWLLLPVVVALFASAAVMITLLLKRKP